MVSSYGQAGLSDERSLRPGRQPAAVWLRHLVPLVVSLGCLGLLLWVFWGQLPAVWRTVRAVQPWVLALAGLPYLLAFYMLAVRLRLVFRVFGIDQPAYRYFLYTLIGLFFSNFLPTGVGGDVVKASYAAGAGDSLAESFLATFIDRGLGLVGVLVIGSVGLSFFPGLQAGASMLWLAAALVGGLAALVLAGRVDRWVGWVLRRLEQLPLARRLRLPRLAQAALGLLRAPRVLALGLVLTLVSLSLSSLSLWITAWALGLSTSYLVFLLLVPVITVAALVPSINGLGVREAAFVVVLQRLMPDESALALAFVFYGLSMACSLIGGIIFLLRRPLGLQLSPSITARFGGRTRMG